MGLHRFRSLFGAIRARPAPPASQLLAATLALACGAALLSALPPLDYHYYADAARAWRVDRASLYTPAAPQFFYAPWSLLLVAPLSLLPDALGRGIFTAFALGALLWGAWRLAGAAGRRAYALGVSAPFTAAVVLLGQWDGLIVGGVGLAWFAVERRRPWLLGAALALIATKPTNAIVPAAVLAAGLIGRRWPAGLLARAAAAPALCLAGSFLACGADWPARYLRFVQETPPLGYNISLWEQGRPLLAGALGLAALLVLARFRFGPEQLAAALAAGLVISPFVAPYHLVVAAPALALVAWRRPALGAALWALGLAGMAAFLAGWADLPLLLYAPGVLAAQALAYSRPR